MRKSISFGGLKVNFWKSGVGFSTGVKGFRIGTGPRGNYVHVGRNGFYYRKTFSSKSKNFIPKQNRETSFHQEHYEFKEIRSEEASQLTDSCHSELLNEISEKNKKIKSSTLWIVSTIIMMFINVGFLAMIIALPAFFYIDKRRKTVILIYEIDKENEEKLQSFYDAFNDIIYSAKKWYIPSKANLDRLYDRKINAGAENLVNRVPLVVSISPPPYFKTNVNIPKIVVGKQILYFLPDKILVYQGKQVGCIDYEKLQIAYNNINFIEESSVPHDTRTIGTTWKYINKSGGPDRRFSNNRQIPIVEYSEINLFSNSGLNIVIQISKPDLGEKLKSTLSKLI